MGVRRRLNVTSHVQYIDCIVVASYPVLEYMTKNKDNETRNVSMTQNRGAGATIVAVEKW